MATINIIKALDPFISAYNPQSIEFTITTAVVPTVVIGSNTFYPTKTATNVGGLDYYVFDCMGLLPYLIGFPPDNIDNQTELSYTLTISIQGSGATTQTTTGVVCHGYESVGENYMNNIKLNGRRNLTIYINSNYFSFWYDGVTGSKAVSIDLGTPDSITINNGYNLIHLGTNTQYKSGQLCIDGSGTGLFLSYIPNTGTNSVYWLNADGCYSLWKFRKTTSEYTTKKSNSVSSLNLNKATTYRISRNISAEKKVKVNLFTVAINDEHYKELTQIQESLSVWYDNRFWNVASCSTSVADCKQNLKFNLVLESEDYAPNY